MAGGLGGDNYVVDSGGDQVIEWKDGGLDTVMSSVSYVLSANVERLFLTGNAAINAAGNGMANALTGNAGANTLIGAWGDDELRGGSGQDGLFGGSGHDDLFGGYDKDPLSGAAGDDELYGDAGNDQIFGGGGSDLVDGGKGNDLLYGGSAVDAFLFEAGRDRIADFQVGSDVLSFDNALYGNEVLSEDEVLSYAFINAGAATFNFGDGHVLTVVGVTGLDQLRGSLYYF